MRTITVEPEQLEASASRMDNHNENYVKLFNNLFQTVDTMANVWKGKDNIAFTNRISEFSSDFRQMSILCTQYADFLRNSARAYRDTQDELASSASNLIH